LDHTGRPGPSRVAHRLALWDEAAVACKLLIIRISSMYDHDLVLASILERLANEALIWTPRCFAARLTALSSGPMSRFSPAARLLCRAVAALSSGRVNPVEISAVQQRYELVWRWRRK
jgi:hypothetical protein